MIAQAVSQPSPLPRPRPAAQAVPPRRGYLSEIIGPPSSGRTTLAHAWLGAATRRGEYAALVDTFDRFDPASGAACGIDLSRMLWVRGQAISRTASALDPAWLPGARAVHGPGTLLERTIDRALEALDLILQSRVCTAVAIDLGDVSVHTLGRIPASTWLRLARVIEGGDTACVVVCPAPVARLAEGKPVERGPARVLPWTRIQQAPLLPERVSTLLARLSALVSERHVGSPRLIVDSTKRGAFEMAAFPSADMLARGMPETLDRPPLAALRRFRLPIPARVLLHAGSPVRVHCDRHGIPGGRVVQAVARDCDEWDVALTGDIVYRIYLERAAPQWFIEGTLD